MLTIAQLNALERDAFTAALGHIFEHSPWVAGAAWIARPFRDRAHLHAELCARMRAATTEEQGALIRAHPDLAGRLAQQGKLTADSSREQAAAGLDRLTDAELTEFRALNDSYHSRFGFPFIICARLNQKSAILAAMRSRINHSAEEEWNTALAEIEKIAALRLAAVVTD
jgi:OHCU decarboxylase